MVKSFAVEAVRGEIGQAVADKMNDLRRHQPHVIFLAVVPRMQQFYAMSPERYETTQVDVLVELP